jgi:hypothetical protein
VGECLHGPNGVVTVFDVADLRQHPPGGAVRRLRQRGQDLGD